MFQTSELDAFLCKQELDRLQRLEDEAAELENTKRDNATLSHLDDFFESHHISSHHSTYHPHSSNNPSSSSPYPVAMSYVSMRSNNSTSSNNDDDVFLRPPLWEDIASSIQNIDPENANMLSTLAAAAGYNNNNNNQPMPHVKLEVLDDIVPCAPTPLLSPLEIKTEKPNLHLMGTYNNNNNNHNNYPIQMHPVHSYPKYNNNNNINVHNHNGHAQQPPPNLGHHTPPYPQPITRLMYGSPLTPPSSEPGSPGATLQPPGAGPPRRTPPPPYPPHLGTNSVITNPQAPSGGAVVIQQQLPSVQQTTTSSRMSSQQSSSTIMPQQQGHITKFNRRNNPELEKRRVHHCDFIGK